MIVKVEREENRVGVDFRAALKDNSVYYNLCSIILPVINMATSKTMRANKSKNENGKEGVSAG